MKTFDINYFEATKLTHTIIDGFLYLKFSLSLLTLNFDTNISTNSDV